MALVRRDLVRRDPVIRDPVIRDPVRRDPVHRDPDLRSILVLAAFMQGEDLVGLGGSVNDMGR